MSQVGPEDILLTKTMKNQSERTNELLRSSEVAVLYRTDNRKFYYKTGLPDNDGDNRFSK